MTCKFGLDNQTLLHMFRSYSCCKASGTEIKSCYRSPDLRLECSILRVSNVFTAEVDHFLLSSFIYPNLLPITKVYCEKPEVIFHGILLKCSPCFVCVCLCVCVCVFRFGIMPVLDFLWNNSKFIEFYSLGKVE